MKYKRAATVGRLEELHGAVVDEDSREGQCRKVAELILGAMLTTPMAKDDEGREALLGLGSGAPEEYQPAIEAASALVRDHQVRCPSRGARLFSLSLSLSRARALSLSLSFSFPRMFFFSRFRIGQRRTINWRWRTWAQKSSVRRWSITSTACVLILTMKWLELRLNKNGNHLLHAHACPRNPSLTQPTHCILMPAQDVRSPTLFWENTEGFEHPPRTRGVLTWRYGSHQVQQI